jgi:hypothetical protein
MGKPAEIAQVVGQRGIVRSEFALAFLQAAFQVGAGGAQVGEGVDRRRWHAAGLDVVAAYDRAGLGGRKRPGHSFRSH